MSAPPEQIPSSMALTYAMVMSAYRDGIPPTDHLPLAALLQPGMSFRGLAKMLELLNITNYHGGYHTALSVASPGGRPTEADIERVRQRLVPFGYEKWLAEEV